MKNRKYMFIFSVFCLFFLTMLFYPNFAFCQSDWEIKRDGSDWYWGEGKSRDREEAREKALKELSSNIAVMVSSSFQNIITETESESSDFLESVVTTYTSASFTNLKPQVRQDEQGRYVFLYYLHKDEMEKEYEARRQLIFDVYKTAEAERETANISRALQYYYYCLILMNSVPDRNLPYNSQNLRTVIPAEIQNILSQVKFIYEGDKRDSESLRTVLLRIEYHGKPVQELDFIYLERGTEYRSIAKDGKAFCELTGASVSYQDLDIEIEYRFAAQRDCIPLVSQLWNGVRRPSFNNKRKIVFTKQEEKPVSTPKTFQPQKAEPVKEKLTYQFYLKKETDAPVQAKISKELNQFLELIEKPEAIEKAFADDKFLQNKMKSAIKYNHPRILEKQFDIEIHKSWNGWEARSIPVACSYPSIATQTMEYLVFDFDDSGTLCDFNFHVFHELYQTFLNDESTSEEELLQRQVIVKFLEKYRTAFLNRDMETLEKIFADEAIIIVGRVLQPSETKRHYNLERNEQEIEYLEKSKETYLNDQQKIFNAQRDIHLGFNSFKMNRKDQETSVFGVSMRQQYKSSGYADEGHLFLLIDFMEQDPLIYVRSWQPAEWSEEQMIKMADFRVLE